MRTNSKKSKLNNLSLSKYEKRVLLESRMSEGHRMFDDLLRVPFIFSGTSLPKNKIIKNQVRHVDIFPTILEILDIKSKVDVDGQSLVPLINGENIEELPAYIESPPTIDGNLKKVIGIRTSKYKFIKSIDDSKKVFELYDLENDPLEEKNIAQNSSKIILNLEKKLSEFSSKTDLSSETSLSADKKQEIREKLRKLGYA